MNKQLREALRAARDAGVEGLEVVHGGRHTKIRFTDRDGAERTVPVQTSRGLHYAGPRLRSQLRKAKHP